MLMREAGSFPSPGSNAVPMLAGVRTAPGSLLLISFVAHAFGEDLAAV
jgi:hypothetical protein